MTGLEASQIDGEPRFLGDLGTKVYRPAAAVGVVALGLSFGVALIRRDVGHFCGAYLVSYCYFLSLSLGALFFVSLQHVSRAGWSVVIRRLAELLAGNMPLMAILVLPILFGATTLYEWTHGPTSASGHADLLAGKRDYLNLPFFLVRIAIYFAVWTWLGRTFLARSVEQDASSDVDVTLRLARFSGLAIVLYALTVTFAAFDLIMSLTPHWYSTILGVYYFAGCMVGFLAVLTLLAMGLQARGLLVRAITREHYHDLGKLLFGFVFFWGYIAFSQYMLIWYANIPEETAWYLVRQQGPWVWVSLALLFGHFVLPFLGLLPRRVKRRRPTLAFWAAWALVMHWVDLYWLIAPTHSPDRLPFGVSEIGCFVGLSGLFVAGLARVSSGVALLPVRDPRLSESLEFENA